MHPYMQCIWVGFCRQNRAKNRAGARMRPGLSVYSAAILITGSMLFNTSADRWHLI